MFSSVNFVGDDLDRVGGQMIVVTSRLKVCSASGEGGKMGNAACFAIGVGVRIVSGAGIALMRSARSGKAGRARFEGWSWVGGVATGADSGTGGEGERERRNEGRRFPVVDPCSGDGVRLVVI